jgi:hypothetical protein
MGDIQDVFGLITKPQDNPIDAEAILEIIFKNNDGQKNLGQDIIQKLKSFQREKGASQSGNEIFEKYNFLKQNKTSFFSFLEESNNDDSNEDNQEVNTPASIETQGPFQIPNKINNLYIKLELVLTKLNLLKYSYIYEDPNPTTISINQKKYYTLESKNKKYYTRDEEMRAIADRTKIAYSPIPDTPPIKSSDSINQHDNPPQLSPRSANKKITGEASNCVMDAIRKSIKLFSGESDFTKLKYFLIAIKLQGINNNKDNFNKLLEQIGETPGDLNYNHAKEISKLFQEQSKKIGLLTGRVSEYKENFKESEIVGMRTKRIPLVLVMELAKEILKTDFELFKQIQNKIFSESPDKYPHPPVPVGRRRNPSSRQEKLKPVTNDYGPRPMEPSVSLTTDLSSPSSLPSSILTPDGSKDQSRSSISAGSSGTSIASAG